MYRSPGCVPASSIYRVWAWVVIIWSASERVRPSISLSFSLLRCLQCECVFEGIEYISDILFYLPSGAMGSDVTAMLIQVWSSQRTLGASHIPRQSAFSSVASIIITPSNYLNECLHPIDDSSNFQSQIKVSYYISIIL